MIVHTSSHWPGTLEAIACGRGVLGQGGLEEGTQHGICLGSTVCAIYFPGLAVVDGEAAESPAPCLRRDKMQARRAWCGMVGRQS